MSFSAVRFWLRQWAKYNTGGYPGGSGSVGDLSNRVSHGTFTELEPHWPDEVVAVDRLLLEMYTSHEDWLSQQLRRAVRMEYISRFRDDVAESRAAMAGMSERTYYRRLEQAHRWLDNNLEIDLARKLG